jgi:hypothetical protein
MVDLFLSLEHLIFEFVSSFEDSDFEFFQGQDCKPCPLGLTQSRPLWTRIFTISRATKYIKVVIPSNPGSGPGQALESSPGTGCRIKSGMTESVCLIAGLIAQVSHPQFQQNASQ